MDQQDFPPGTYFLSTFKADLPCVGPPRETWSDHPAPRWPRCVILATELTPSVLMVVV